MTSFVQENHPMPMESIQFKILVQCDKCGHATALNGISEQIPCPGCDNPIALAGKYWLRLLGDFIRDDLRVPVGTVDDTEVYAYE